MKNLLKTSTYEILNSTFFQYAYEHPFNLNSKCVRTTFLKIDNFQRVLTITNFVDSLGLLTRIYGSAIFNNETKGYDSSYFALRKKSFLIILI